MRKNFITGLILLLPLAITIAVLSFVINFLTKPFLSFMHDALNRFEFMHKGFLFLSPEQILLYTSKVLILFALFLFTLALGLFTRWFLTKSLINLSDRILQRIPIINTVYKTTQDIIKTLFVSDRKSFEKVVMVPFPRPDIYVLGLLVREAPKSCCEKVNKDLVSVLVPTTPNPTTGFLMMIERDQIIHVNIKPEDAIKYIISCGVIIPGETVSTPANL